MRGSRGQIINTRMNLNSNLKKKLYNLVKRLELYNSLVKRLELKKKKKKHTYRKRSGGICRTRP